MKHLSKKQINFEEPTFIANGVTYRISPQISLERWMEFEKLEYQSFFGKSAADIWGDFERIFDLANKSKLADIAVIAHNNMNTIKNTIQKKVNVDMQICALFVVSDDEDLMKYDQSVMDKKISDWTSEYDVSGFFLLAANLVRGYTNIYNELIKPYTDEKAAQTK